MKKILRIILALFLVPSYSFSASQNNIKVDKLVLGSSTATDKTLEFNTGAGSANPKIKINASGGKLQFANDGSNYKDLGSGSGSGAGINLIDNSGFEQGVLGWTNSGGTFSQVTTGTNLLHGTKSVTFDASASAQYVETDAVAIPVILQGQNCLARIYYKGSDSNLLLEATNESNVQLGSTVLTSKSLVSSATVNFPCPSSGSLKLRVRSTADSALIAFDNVTLGQADNIVQATSQVATTYSAQINQIPLATASGLSPATYVAKSNTTFIQSFDVVQLTTYWYIQVNFVPGTFTENPTCVINANISTVTGGNVAQSSTIFQSTTSYVRFTPFYSWTSGSQQATAVNIVCQKTGSDFTGSVQQSMGYKPEQVAWRVDANIGGSNPNLGTVAVSSYTGIEDAALTLTNNTGAGVISAQIPCSSTNSPTGTTCSVGNESVGVSFNLPVAGDVLACANFGVQYTLGAAGTLTSTFQLVETAANAQTILQEGKSRAYIRANVVSAYAGQAQRVCGTFNFTSAGQKTIRLMYEQAVSGTISGASVMADQGPTYGQSDIHFEVYPLNNYVPTPLLIGSVVSSSVGIEKIERASADAVCSTGTCVLADNTPGIANITFVSAGTYSINFTAGTYSVAPTCMITPGSSQAGSATIQSRSTSAVTFATRNAAGTAANNNFYVSCSGLR